MLILNHVQHFQHLLLKCTERKIAGLFVSVAERQARNDGLRKMKFLEVPYCKNVFFEPRIRIRKT